MSEEPVHPRNTYSLDGADGPEQALIDSLTRGRMHHAWLLIGPEGVGKATFAYRAARRLLGAKPALGHGLLGASPDDPVSRMIAGQAHPDLMVLERQVEDGKTKKFISVDEARGLPGFFSRSPAIAPYRVAIIDAVDDMNANAANAVLKTLEEPPERGVVFLVSSAPGRLLPTIRSRCRRLVFAPWDLGRLTDLAMERTGLEFDQAQRLAQMAKGAPGRVLDSSAEHVLAMDQLAKALVERLPAIDDSEILGLTEGFRGAEGANRFALLMDRLADQIEDMTTSQAMNGQLSTSLEQWALAWSRLTALPAQVEGLNLDRTDALWTVLTQLRAAARA